MDSPRLSHSAALILKALSLGYCFGFDIMEATGLPSGTVYPALRRLERDELVVSRWEFVGVGYLTTGDTALAGSAAARARERRQAARDAA